MVVRCLKLANALCQESFSVDYSHKMATLLGGKTDFFPVVLNSYKQLRLIAIFGRVLNKQIYDVSTFR